MGKKKKNYTVTKAFGRRLSELRRRQGISQAKLAKKVGYQQAASMSQIESGRSPADVRVIAKLIEVLDADAHWLIAGQPSPSTMDLLQRLKPCAELYLNHLNKEIDELNRDLVGLELRHTFKGEQNLKTRKKKEAALRQLQSEYALIVSTVQEYDLKEKK